MRKNTVFIQGNKISLSGDLTATQQRILKFLDDNFNEYVSCSEIEDACAPESNYLYEWTSRVHISKIRSAIKNIGFDICCARSYGYKLIKKQEEESNVFNQC